MTLVGAKNVYTCDCGARIVTVDVDEGTTPFAVPHRSFGSTCVGVARSSFYRFVPTDPPTYEWFRPTEKEVQRRFRYAGKEGVRAMLEHVRAGGLIERPVVARTSVDGRKAR